MQPTTIDEFESCVAWKSPECDTQNEQEVLQQENDLCNLTFILQDTIRTMKCNLIPHPLCLSNMPPSDYHLLLFYFSLILHFLLINNHLGFQVLMPVCFSYLKVMFHLKIFRIRNLFLVIKLNLKWNYLIYLVLRLCCRIIEEYFTYPKYLIQLVLMSRAFLSQSLSHYHTMKLA